MAKKLVLLLLALLAFASLTKAHGDHDGHDHGDDEEEEEETASGPSEVVVLDDTNFEEHVKSNDITMIEFYAPWCGHCKALAPEYDKASVALKGQIKIAKVDCTEHRDLCEKYDVQGFPTIKIFRNDGSEPTDYDSARKADAIVKFMLKQKQPAYVVLKSQKEVDDFVADDGDIEIVGFISESDKASFDAFVAVAKSLRNEHEFAVVYDSSLVPGGAAQPTAVLYRKFDEPQVTHSGEWTEGALGDFVRSNAFPLVGEIGPENYQKYLERGYPLVWIFINKNKDQAVLTAAAEAAKEFRTALSVVWLDGERWADHAKTFGLSGETPGIVIEDRDARKNYIFPAGDAVTGAALTTFFTGFSQKTLIPHVKSEEIPEKNDGPVKVVVGKSFDSIVLDATKDVLIEFYAPWCGHCKSLAPKYEKLGEMFADTPSIVIAKIDATENDTPVDIRGFPTLMFYPADDKANPLTYEGDRTEQAMASFVRDNASTLKKADGAAPAKPKGHDEL